jgi:hypothetical protein
LEKGENMHRVVFGFVVLVSLIGLGTATGGDPTKPEQACEPPPETKEYGWSLKGDDCNDKNPDVFPG